MKNISFAVIVLAVSLMGCGQENNNPPAPTKTPEPINASTPANAEIRNLDWYKANPEEAAKEVAKCNKLPPQEALQNANCEMASRAKQSAAWSAKGGAIQIKPLTAEDLKNR